MIGAETMDQDLLLPELAALLRQQRAAHRQAPFPEWAVRKERLQRLHAMLRTAERQIEEAIDADFDGRPRMETQLAELFPAMHAIRTACSQGRRWMKPRRAPVSKWFLPARAYVQPRPLGVIGIIVPWNYPLFLTIGPLAGALAAGNRAMIKLSEHAPRFAALFQRLIADTFEPAEVVVVTGGPDTAAAFAGLAFDHLLFTGSGAVGRKVLAAASERLVPTTLELGGKSPAVIAPGYDIAHAARRIMTGKLLNAGQTCIAPDYVLVPRAQLASFTEQARAQARAMYPAGLADPDYCSIISARQYRRLRNLLAEAQAAGAHCLPLFEGTQADDERARLAPSIVIEPAGTLGLMEQEIFGPILPVLAYEELADACALIAARPHPLALYWFDADRRRARQALRELSSGGACINDTLLHATQESLPFGGIGPSGMGHYHGRWGFDTLSKLTPVFQQSRFSGAALFVPPYRPIARRLLALMRRF